jgi:hypothetical protein
MTNIFENGGSTIFSRVVKDLFCFSSADLWNGGHTLWSMYPNELCIQEKKSYPDANEVPFSCYK